MAELPTRGADLGWQDRNVKSSKSQQCADSPSRVADSRTVDSDHRNVECIDAIAAAVVEDKLGAHSKTNRINPLLVSDAPMVKMVTIVSLTEQFDMVKNGTTTAQAGNVLEMSAETYLSMAVEEFRKGHDLRAFENAQYCLHLQPNNPQAFEVLAWAAARLGAPELALSFASHLDAGSHSALAIKAQSYLLQGKPDDVRKTLLRLAAIPTQREFVEDIEAGLTLSEGNFELGLFETAELCRRNPRNRAKRQQFTSWYKKLADSDEAGRFPDFMTSLGLEIFLQPILERSVTVPVTSVDIIIPVFDALADLQACLASLRRWSGICIERIILVDDRSSETTRHWLQDYASKHSDVILLINEQNLGFSRTVIRGIEHSTAQAFVTLNSDTILTQGWLDRLLDVLNEDERNALVGPLSNNAFFQSILPQEKNFTADKLAAIVSAFSRSRHPRVPFLSGFCLLMRRSAYDVVGGIDAEAFPRGYYEVQDLSLRLLDMGFFSCIADDSYVHHNAGRSIESIQKQQLIAEGFITMCDKFGSLKIMAAEAVCMTNVEVQFFRDLIAKSDLIENIATPQMNKPKPASCKVVMELTAEIANGAEVCLFVTHAPFGAANDFVLSYLDEFRREGVVVALCVIVNDLANPITGDWVSHADAVVLRTNAGFDFGAWSDLLKQFPQCWDAERIYFVNDSLLGPFDSISPILKEIRVQNCGLSALSDCSIGEYHVQSYFFAWNKTNLASEDLRAFWQNIENLDDKSDVIARYERGLSKLSAMLPDPSLYVVFSLERLFGCRHEELSGVSPTHHGWRAMLKHGFPFVKTAVLRDGSRYKNTSALQEVLDAIGVDVVPVMKHIEMSRIFRLANT